MSLEATIKAKADELRELYPLVEQGDAEAIKNANAIADELDELKNRKASADRFKSILGDLGDVNAHKGPAAKATLADEIADGVKGVNVHEHFERSFEINSIKAAATDVLQTTTIADLSTIVPTIPQDLGVLELFGSETISGNTLEYFIALGFTGSPAAVAELGAKPQIGPSYTKTSDKLTKVAAWWKESDEAIEDAPYLASALRDRGIYLLHKAEEAQVLSGNGTDPNMEGVLNRTGIQTLNYTAATANNNGTLAKQIFLAMSQVAQVSGFNADAIVLNPLDYFTLRTATDQNGQYFGGGYFTGAYGQGGVSVMPNLWGLRTVQSNSISQGTVLVGAFKPGASIFRKTGSGLRVEIANQHDDDFTHNRITVLLESRLGLAVRYPQAFVKLTASA